MVCKHVKRHLPHNRLDFYIHSEALYFTPKTYVAINTFFENEGTKAKILESRSLAVAALNMAFKFFKEEEFVSEFLVNQHGVV